MTTASNLSFNLSVTCLYRKLFRICLSQPYNNTVDDFPVYKGFNLVNHYNAARYIFVIWHCEICPTPDSFQNCGGQKKSGELKLQHWMHILSFTRIRLWTSCIIYNLYSLYQCIFLPDSLAADREHYRHWNHSCRSRTGRRAASCLNSPIS